MNSFLKLYASFELFTPGKVARMAYQQATKIQKAFLWGTKFIFIVFWIAFMLAENGTLYFIVVICSAPVWLASFRLALKHFSSQFSIDPLALKLHWKDHQAIRYALFSKELSPSITIVELDTALKYLDIEINTSPSPAAFPLSAQALSALFLAIVGGVVGEWSKEFVAIILITSGLYVSFHFLLHRFNKSHLDQLREFQRFLLWKKDECERQSLNSQPE